MGLGQGMEVDNFIGLRLFVFFNDLMLQPKRYSNWDVLLFHRVTIKKDIYVLMHPARTNVGIAVFEPLGNSFDRHYYLLLSKLDTFI